MGCVYGIANFLSGKYYLPGCSFAELRPQVALPMFIGVLCGPLAGFATGASGDMLGYAFAGKGPLFALHWSFANGLMELIPELAALGVSVLKKPFFERLTAEGENLVAP